LRTIAALALAWIAVTGAFYEWGGAGARGVRELKDKKYEDAIRSFREGRSQLPRSAAVRYDQALAFQGARNADSAAAAYRDAATLRGDEARASAAYNLGNEALRNGANAAAAQLYREALRIDPRRVDAKKNLEEAIRRARKRDPNPPQSGGSGGSAPQSAAGAKGDGEGKQPPGAAPQQSAAQRPGESTPEKPPGTAPQLGSGVPDRAEAEHWLDALEAERKAARLRDRGGERKETGQRDW